LASQRQFEGPVLEELLERVRIEAGPDARIVAANRVRKGGVGGFFAKQAFEVLVETSDATADAAMPAPGTTRPPVFTRSQSPPPALASPLANAAQARADGHAPATILELADAVSDDERNGVIDLVEERTVSTQSHDFADVLNRVSRSIDATPEELAAFPEPDPHGADIDLRDATRPAPSPAATAPLPNEPTEPAPQPDDDLDLRAHTAIERLTTNGTLSARARAPRATEPAASPAVIDRYETRLSRLGVPAKLIPRGAAATALKGALVESLTRLPPPPAVPSGFGVVIAIVGDGAAPVALARDLAADIGLDPDDVVLATREPLGCGIPAWLQMSDAATAGARRRSWARRNRPTIVACSLPAGARGRRWAHEILDDLEPTITWGIVDAGAKREDIAHRVDALGGVDVLALDNLDGTVSPAAPLELGIPVGRLELEHASPLTWTELLLERMALERSSS
jgi:hypothetical protein